MKIKNDIKKISFNNNLQERLPKVRGKYIPNYPLGKRTWFGVGGAAEVLFKPADKEDLIEFIKLCPKDIPLMVLGMASNLIIRDGGVSGVVIKLGGKFSEIKHEDKNITVGSGALDLNLALTALKYEIAGLEFLSGIPGTIGGALRMNAGAYGLEIKDVLISAEILFANGSVKNMTADEMGLSYRHNNLPQDVIFLGCTLKGHAGNYADIEKNMNDIKKRRLETQPIKSKTGGSTFKNPQGVKKAWQLIDEAGCRGLKIGGAEISEKHANFMVNKDAATAEDLENLGEEVIKRVYEKSGIKLLWEIKLIGIKING